MKTIKLANHSFENKTASLHYSFFYPFQCLRIDIHKFRDQTHSKLKSETEIDKFSYQHIHYFTQGGHWKRTRVAQSFKRTKGILLPSSHGILLRPAASCGLIFGPVSLVHVSDFWHWRIIRVWVCQQGTDGQQNLFKVG